MKLLCKKLLVLIGDKGKLADDKSVDFLYLKKKGYVDSEGSLTEKGRTAYRVLKEKMPK